MIRRVIQLLGLGPQLARAMDQHNQAADRLDAVLREIMGQ